MPKKIIAGNRFRRERRNKSIQKGGIEMFGLASIEMGFAYLACFLAALLCTVYGIWKRNEAGPPEKVIGGQAVQGPKDPQT